MTMIPLVAWALLAGAPLHVPVEDGQHITPVNVRIEQASHEGKKALRVVESSDRYDGSALAMIDGVQFADGTIDVDVAGRPSAGSAVSARGFVGLAFRSARDGRTFECFYIRPTNGRADDQLRRNHSTQYVSEPEYPWERLRTESPGVYESYVDLETGAWTHLRIEVEGVKARLFVNGSTQPVLLVNDLKHGAAGGTLGLWIGAGTEGYFRNLTVTPK